MSIVSEDVIKRLAPSSVKPGQKIKWVTVHAPAEAIWLELRRWVADYDVDQFTTYVDQAGRTKKHTRYDQGFYYGQIRALAKALAYLLVGHDYTHGDAAEIVIQAARNANRVEAGLAQAGTDK